LPAQALTTLDILRKQTTEARGLRRAHAVREGVAGHQINAVSAACHLAHAARRTGVQRFAQEGPQGVRERPRSGRPPTVTCELAPPLQRLIEQAPFEHGALQSQGSGRALAAGLARATGVHLGRASVRSV
jgi:transposase